MQIPKFLLSDFTYQGRLPVEHSYFDDAHDTGRDLDGGSAEEGVWTEDEVEDMVAHFARSDEPQGWYSSDDVRRIKRHLEEVVPGGVEGKQVLVIGTKVSEVVAVVAFDVVVVALGIFVVNVAVIIVVVVFGTVAPR